MNGTIRKNGSHSKGFHAAIRRQRNAISNTVPNHRTMTATTQPNNLDPFLSDAGMLLHKGNWPEPALWGAGLSQV